MSGNSGVSGLARRSAARPTLRQGLTLTLVFMAVLITGAATDAWGGAGPHERGPAGRPGSADSADSAAQAAPAAAPRPLADDPWATRYSPTEYTDFARALDGRYIGVGVRLRSTPEGPVVSGVRTGGPAERHGVRTGDRLLAVDGRTVRERSVTETLGLLRGEHPGSTVRLTTLRRSGSHPRTVRLRRGTLRTEDVRTDRLRPRGSTSRGGAPRAPIANIRIGAFSRGVQHRVAEAVRRPEHPSGVVLDLRGSTGGLVAESVGVASVFLDGGTVARYRGHGGRTRTLSARPGGRTEVPLVVLVDSATMSAAELLAGALQDRGRAVVVGSRTYGKGAVQEPTRLADGSVLERTVGHYRTPSGRRVDGTGIRPDVEVAPDSAEREALTVLSGLEAAPPRRG